jgi:hypothetical protein
LVIGVADHGEGNSLQSGRNFDPEFQLSTRWRSFIALTWTFAHLDGGYQGNLDFHGLNKRSLRRYR